MSEQQYWVAGYNLSPYMPDPDNLFVTGEWSDALTYLVDTLESWWSLEYEVLPARDDWQDGEYEAAVDDIDGRYLEAHTALHNAPVGTVSVLLTNDRGYTEHLWIEPTDEKPEDE